MAPSNTVEKNCRSEDFKIDSEQALKASKALILHIQKTVAAAAANAKTKNILDVVDEDTQTPVSVAETPIWMTVTTKRHIHDSKKLQPSTIHLPHPLHNDPEATICLIAADPQRHYKNIVADDAFPTDLRQRITRVVDLKHITAKFRQYEAQRKLVSEHDIFLADDRIINRLPKALGKTFYKSTSKRPIPVVLQKRKLRQEHHRGERVKRNTNEVNCRPISQFVAEIRKAIGAALVHLSPSTSTAVKVGFAGMEPQALAENIVKAAEEIANRFVPKKKNGVRSIYVKGAQTLALPIWQDDELWLDAETDVSVKGSEEAKAIEERKERANVGKKRKVIEDLSAAGNGDGAETPKSKKPKTEKILPESNDDKLDEKIKERKSKLRSAKDKAKSAMND